VKVLSIQDAGWRFVGLVDGEGCEEAGEVLHVGNVATEADDATCWRGGGWREGEETVDVGEAGEGAVRCCLLLEGSCR
jgi:hypothetical protein